MRVVRTLGLLALVALACELGLWLTTGWAMPETGRYAMAGQLGTEAGRLIFIFLVAAATALTVALIARKQYYRPYPGLASGSLVALIVTALLWAVRQGNP